MILLFLVSVQHVGSQNDPGAVDGLRNWPGSARYEYQTNAAAMQLQNKGTKLYKQNCEGRPQENGPDWCPISVTERKVDGTSWRKR